MQVTVRFFGNYRAVIESPQFSFELNDERPTPLHVLNLLTERYGDKLRSALLVERAGAAYLKSGIRIAVGDEIIDFSSDLRKPLPNISHTADEPIRIFIFPSLMGGR